MRWLPGLCVLLVPFFVSCGSLPEADVPVVGQSEASEGWLDTVRERLAVDHRAFRLAGDGAYIADLAESKILARLDGDRLPEMPVH